MTNSKLITLLRTLNPKELKDLGKFLNSPFINTNPSLVLLYQYLRQYHPDFPVGKLDKAQVFKHLFPKRSYTVKKMYGLMSNLSLVVEDFLVYQQLQKQPFKKQQLLVAALSEKPSLYPLFTKRIAEAQTVRPEKIAPTEQHFHKYELNRQLFFHPYTPKYEPDVESLEQAIHHLDHFYALSKIKLVCEMLFRSDMLVDSINTNLPETLRLWLARLLETKQSVLVSLYIRLITLHQSRGKEESFNALFLHFKAHWNDLPSTEARFVLQQLCNYLIALHNTGKGHFLRPLLELYQWGLDTQILASNGITEAAFINIAVTAAAQGKINWAKQFIAQYESLLLQKEGLAACSFALAYCHFYENQLDDALQELAQIDIRTSFYAHRVRELEIRIFYEQYLQTSKMVALLKSKLTAFDAFLKRHTSISPSEIEALQNMSRWVRRLVQIREKGNGNATVQQALLAELADTQPIVARTWLKEKILNISH